MITIEDFKKLDIRIGKVISAERVEGSEKLIKFIFDIGGSASAQGSGETMEQRQIIGGLALAFPDPSVLVGRQMPLILNLEPRKLMGLESQGMIMAADNEGIPVPLSPVDEVPPGSSVK
jgi:methionine--tRNA ligase beta chain